MPAVRDPLKNTPPPFFNVVLVEAVSSSQRAEKTMPTKLATGTDHRAHPSLALLLCHCGKWAFRVDSHFPLFDRGLAVERPSVGCPIDWHVVPMPDPPPRTSMKSEKFVLPAMMDPNLVRAIHGRQLLAYDQGGEVPGIITADDPVFFYESI